MALLGVGRFVFRTAVLAYAALLIVGAWPYHEAPVIGSPARWASWILAKISIRAGMPVFNAGAPDHTEWKLVAVCQRIVGVGADGQEEVLYAPECPPSGLRIGTDSFEVLTQRVARGTNEYELLPRDGLLPDPRTRGMRRYTALGDFFCRASEAGASRFPRTRLAQRREFQSYETGRRRSGRILVCSWHCDEAPAPRPRCLKLPAGADPSVFEGPAS